MVSVDVNLELIRRATLLLDQKENSHVTLVAADGRNGWSGWLATIA